MVKSILKTVLISTILFSNIEFFAQCPSGQSELFLTTSGGSFTSEKWVNITTSINGAGVVIWAQGNGNYGDAGGLVTNESVCVINGGQYYINTYDNYGDGWDGTIYKLTAQGGAIIANNNGVSPDNGVDNDANGGVFDNQVEELESSEMFEYFPPACSAPSNIDSANFTLNSIEMSWTENGSATSWNIQWDDAGFTPGTGNAINNVSTNPFTITGLQNARTYDVYVQSSCGGNLGNSEWSGPFSFSTPCGIIIPGYTQEFTEDPICWTFAGSGDITSGPIGIGAPGTSASDWSLTTYLNDGGLIHGQKINLFSNVDQEWMLTPTFDLSTGGPYELVVGAGVTDWGNPDPATMGSDDQVQVLVSTDLGVSWVSLHTWRMANQPAVTGDFTTIDLTAYTGADVRFAIYATDGTTDDTEDYDFHIGSFKVKQINPNSITELNSKEIALYPNPNNGEFYISSKVSLVNTLLTVMDLNGKIVHSEQTNLSSIEKKSISINDLTSGMYILTIQTENSIINKTIVIE